MEISFKYLEAVSFHVFWTKNISLIVSNLQSCIRCEVKDCTDCAVVVAAAATAPIMENKIQQLLGLSVKLYLFGIGYNLLFV